MSTYKDVLQKTGNQKLALAAAQNSLEKKKKYRKMKGSLAQPRKYKFKSALVDSEQYYADCVFGDTDYDDDGDDIPRLTLDVDLGGMRGDIEHADGFHNQYVEQYGYNPFKFDMPLFTVVESKLQDDKLYGTIQFNTEHPMFEEAWNLSKIGQFGISLEYEGTDEGDWKICGITGAKNPKNSRSKMIASYKK